MTEARHMMPDGGGGMRPTDTADRLDVPIRRGELMAQLSMRLADARELRDWLNQHVRDADFGGEQASKEA